MSGVIVYLLIASIAQAQYHTIGNVQGISKGDRIETNIRPDVPSNTVGLHSKQFCYHYSDFVVVEVDSGEIGNNSHTLSLSFHAPLKVNCSLHKDPDTCWQNIRKLNNIPADVKLAVPHCEKEYAELSNQSDLLNRPDTAQVLFR